MVDFDVVVVGSGPSGSTTARYLTSAGKRVLLVDKANFPRKKICAGLLNGAIFERFPYLEEKREKIVEKAFEGIAFYNPNLTEKVEYVEDKPVGYLTSRYNFDDILRQLATEAGAETQVGREINSIESTAEGVKAGFSDGKSISASFLVGADGVTSKVGKLSRLNRGWSSSRLTVCMNQDVPLPEERISSFYGEKSLIYVVPAYSFLTGYAWVFPKKNEITIGLGGQASKTSGIGETFRRFVRDAKKAKLLPPEVEADDPDSALVPVGAALDSHNSAGGRVLLVGDAAGFVSGHTGEGIFPGMIGAEVAAKTIVETLDGESIESLPERYERAWRRELGDFLRTPDAAELLLVGMMFTDKSLVPKIARTYLSGKPIR